MVTLDHIGSSKDYESVATRGTRRAREGKFTPPSVTLM